MLNTLGERIAYHRKKCELTQEQLAEQCSVTAQAVSKWENNLTAPDIALLPRLAELFGITCDELLGAKRRETVAVDPATVDPSKLMIRLRIRSGNEQTGQNKVNINLPLPVAETVLESGSISILKGIDLEQIGSLVQAGVMGKLVEIESEDGDTVEIWVE